jgi:hypothetical protein
MPDKEIVYRKHFSPDSLSWNYLVISENKLENLKSHSLTLYRNLVAETARKL